MTPWIIKNCCWYCPAPSILLPSLLDLLHSPSPLQYIITPPFTSYFTHVTFSVFLQDVTLLLSLPSCVNFPPLSMTFNFPSLPRKYHIFTFHKVLAFSFPSLRICYNLFLINVSHTRPSGCVTSFCCYSIYNLLFLSQLYFLSPCTSYYMLLFRLWITILLWYGTLSLSSRKVLPLFLLLQRAIFWPTLHSLIHFLPLLLLISLFSLLPLGSA